MTAMWLGPVPSEARAVFQRARESGMSPPRALVIGHIGSQREMWAFRRTIAAAVGCAVRTVGRAIRQAKEAGLINTWRAKKNEVPPGAKAPIPCGWSHRTVLGWGQAGQAVKDAVHAARARWLVKVAVPAGPGSQSQTSAAGVPTPRPVKHARAAVPARSEYQGRKWTAAEIDQELERRERLNKPPPWAPDTS